jgi:hypothetical protein
VSTGKNHIKVTLKQAHRKLKHIKKQIASILGWTLVGNVEICKACAEAKANQKKIVGPFDKSSTTENEIISGHVHLDMISVKSNESVEVELTYKPYWKIIVN